MESELYAESMLRSQFRGNFISSAYSAFLDTYNIVRENRAAVPYLINT